MSHLEDLIVEYYDWQGYLVKRNIKVGRLGHGGWEGELDVVAYHPLNKHLIHLEPSVDADTWATREKGSKRSLHRAKSTFFLMFSLGSMLVRLLSVKGGGKVYQQGGVKLYH
jgi:hypothetical protein